MLDYRTTKVLKPQSNGFIDLLHRLLLDEHFPIKGLTLYDMFKRV